MSADHANAKQTYSLRTMTMTDFRPGRSTVRLLQLGIFEQSLLTIRVKLLFSPNLKEGMTRKLISRSLISIPNYQVGKGRLFKT